MSISASRRDFLSAAASAGALTAGLLGTASSAAQTKAGAPGAAAAEDPQERFRRTVKMRGSLADGPVHTFVRLHIYGYDHAGNLVPFFSMNNYAVNVWRKLASGNYAVQVFEGGVYAIWKDLEKPPAPLSSSVAVR